MKTFDLLPKILVGGLVLGAIGAMLFGIGLPCHNFRLDGSNGTTAWPIPGGRIYLGSVA